jgi:hypothetical protein
MPRLSLSGTWYNVYGSPGPGLPIDYGVPLAQVQDLAWTSASLAAPGIWSFGVRAAGAGGEEQNLDCAVSIAVDADGADITDIPSPPIALRAIPTAGAGVTIHWGYSSASGPRTPTGFHLYIGTGGAPDYAAPVQTIPFGAAILGGWTTRLIGLTDGTAYSIGVRAFNASGEEANTTSVRVTADATGPRPVDLLTATAVV